MRLVIAAAIILATLSSSAWCQNDDDVSDWTKNGWPSTFSMASTKPGNSIGQLHLRMPQTEAESIMGWPDSEKHVRGYVEYTWKLYQNKTVDVLFQHGRAVQISLTRQPNILTTNFAKLKTNGHWTIKCRTYSFCPPKDACYAEDFFDDTTRGIAFSAGTQDDFIMQDNLPTSIIVHPVGQHIIPIRDGIMGQRDLKARVFMTEADAAKADSAGSQ